MKQKLGIVMALMLCVVVLVSSVGVFAEGGNEKLQGEWETESKIPILTSLNAISVLPALTALSARPALIEIIALSD